MKICAFGEMLIRLNPLNKETFAAIPKYLEIYFGGSEVNFLVNISNLGGKAVFISALPKNPIGDAAVAQLNRFNINGNFVVRSDKGRMGIYFVEEGVSNRSSNVIYDRNDSAINCFTFEDYHFNKVFSKNNIYHISGITPALSARLMDISIRSVRLAKEMGLEVSCDLNYRAKLWNYKVDNKIINKSRIMSDMVTYCDYLFGNETDIQNFFGIEKKNNFKDNEDLLIYYQNILLKISKLFPHLKIVALSIRDSKSANSNYIGGVLYIRQTNQFFFSPNHFNQFEPYLIEPVYDRIGSGDSFSSAILFGLSKFNENIQKALDFAVASSVLKHSYRGDFNYAGYDDVIAIVNGEKFGRIRR